MKADVGKSEVGKGEEREEKEFINKEAKGVGAQDKKEKQ